MPELPINGARIHYEDSGHGEQTIVFAHGLLMDGRMFEAQLAAFSDRYRCITFDFRGQGRSEVTPDGYDLDSLTEDAASLIESLGVAGCHFAGLSMGGFVAMRLAARRPELLSSLILFGTSAEPEPAGNLPRYRLLKLIARWLGPGLVAGQIMPILFGRKFLRDEHRRDEKALWRKRISANHKIGITRAVSGVIFREGIMAELDRIEMPTLVLVGEQDVATVPAEAERIHAGIRGSKLVVIPGAGHSSVIEESEAVNREVDSFLSQL